jgi:hypothetical protein
MSSARYLEVGEFYDYLMQKRGALVATSFKLHTLVALGDQLDGMYHGYYPEYPHHATVPLPEIPPTLRCLLIQQTQVLRNSRFPNWSTLTHLSLDPVYLVQLSTWFTLIRELVHLQWGDFSIMISHTGAVGVQPNPPMFALSSLLALSISCYSIRGIELPITTLFQNLELPALHTLYLASADTTWRNATSEIGNLLKSAPAITKLALRNFLHGFNCCFVNDNPSTGALTPIGSSRQVLSSNSPHVSHLQVMLSLTYVVVAELVSEFVKACSISNSSLNLASPTETIPLIIITVLSDNIWMNHPDWRKRLLQCINERIVTEPNISFQINKSEGGQIFNHTEAILQRWRSNI